MFTRAQPKTKDCRQLANAEKRGKTLPQERAHQPTGCPKPNLQLQIIYMQVMLYELMRLPLYISEHTQTHVTVI